MPEEYLALYVGDEPAPEPGPRHLVHERLARRRQPAPSADASWASLVGPAAPFVSAASMRPTAHHQIVRLILARPAVASIGFDRWSRQLGAEILTPDGAFRPDRDAILPDSSQLRRIRGVLDVWGSVFAVPVVLELLPWGTWRAAVSLRPVPHASLFLRYRRGRRYFTAGHAVMDVITAAVRSEAEVARGSKPQALLPVSGGSTCA